VNHQKAKLKNVPFISKCMFVIMLLFPVNFIGQEVNKITINNDLVGEYIYEFTEIAKSNGLILDSIIRNKVDYILVTPDENSIPNLAETSKEKSYILLSKKLEIDSVILKMILFRELWYLLGIPYDSSIIMNQKQREGFTFSGFDNKDILTVEMNRISDYYKLIHEQK